MFYNLPIVDARLTATNQGLLGVGVFLFSLAIAMAVILAVVEAWTKRGKCCAILMIVIPYV